MRFFYRIRNVYIVIVILAIGVIVITDFYIGLVVSSFRMVKR